MSTHTFLSTCTNRWRKDPFQNHCKRFLNLPKCQDVLLFLSVLLRAPSSLWPSVWPAIAVLLVRHHSLHYHAYLEYFFDIFGISYTASQPFFAQLRRILFDSIQTLSPLRVNADKLINVLSSESNKKHSVGKIQHPTNCIHQSIFADACPVQHHHLGILFDSFACTGKLHHDWKLFVGYLILSVFVTTCLRNSIIQWCLQA